MSEDPGFRICGVDDSDRTHLIELAELLLVRGVAWRAALDPSSSGPGIGIGTSCDVSFDPEVLVGLVSLLVDVQGLSESRSHDPDHAPDDVWSWLRGIRLGEFDGSGAELVSTALGVGFDTAPALAELDRVLEEILAYWCSEPSGPSRLFAWARGRESERRAALERLESLRRRYDRDLLILADRLAESQRSRD